MNSAPPTFHLPRMASAFAAALMPLALLVSSCGSGDETEIESAPSFHTGQAPSPSPNAPAILAAGVVSSPVPGAALPAPPIPIAQPAPETRMVAAVVPPSATLLSESGSIPKLTPLPPLQDLANPPPAKEEGFKFDHPQTIKLDPQQVGSVSIEKVASPNQIAAGSISFTRIGDYALRNEKVILVFAAVIPRDPGEPVVVLENRPPGMRLPGSLVDFVTPGFRADFLTEFSQGLGIESAGHFVAYDSAEFVKRDAQGDAPAAAGLRLAGSTVKAKNEVRIQTTYWLAPGATRAEVETEIIGGDPDAEIADFFHTAPGVLLSDIYGPPGPTSELRDVEWLAGHAGGLSMGLAAPGGRLTGQFLRSQARIAAYKKENEQNRPLRKRLLYFGEGNFSSVTDQIFSAPGFPHPVGKFKGNVSNKQDGEKADEGWVDVFWYDRAIGPDSNKMVTRIGINPDSSFSAVLPCLYDENSGRYFVGAGSRSRQGGLSNMGIVVPAGGETERELSIGPQGKLTVRCIDSKTSEPLVCRIRFEPVPPAPSSRFNSIVDPKGYLDSFYVPREGATIPMNAGVYTLTAIHGVNYELGQADVQIAFDQETVATIPLVMSNPTPGWVGLHIGAMTKSTPSCMLTAEDQVLMAAGEGLHWIISGDFETITDFAPVIERMGYKGLLGASRGFRTLLPLKPEWGEFIVYPVAADAPDPKTARERWKGLADAAEFFALLRQLYPGALIEACHPYSDALNKNNKNTGTGYFYHPNWTVYEMAYNDDQRTEKIDFGLDAVNLFSPRGDWNYYWDKDFYFINTQHNRFYIPAPVSESRVAFLGEPGWPRLIIRTEESDVAKLTEAKLFEDMRAGKWQITSGPFVDFTADGRREGDRYHPDSKKTNVALRIRAPLWAPTTNIDLCKDGIMLWKEADNMEAEITSTLRYEREDGVEIYPELRGDSDTMLSGATWSPRTIDAVARGSLGVGVVSLAWNAPIFCDSNGNGKHDPPIYRDRGK